MSSYPNVNVEFVEDIDPNNPIDIVETSTEYSWFEFRRNEYAQDLSASSFLRAQYSSYAPQIKEVLGDQEKILAIPIDMKINPWYYDAERWEEIGLPPPPKTMDEFYTLIHLWADCYAGDYPNTVLTGDPGNDNMKNATVFMIKDQYIYEVATGKKAVDFDTPAFRNMLERVLNLPPNMPVAIEWGGMPPLIRARSVYPFWGTLMQIDTGTVDDRSVKAWDGRYKATAYKPILPPSLEVNGFARMGAKLIVLTLLKNAPNADLALEYLTFIAAYAGLDQPDLSFMLAPENGNASVLSESIQDFYCDALPHLSFFADTFGGDYCADASAGDFYPLFVHPHSETHQEIEKLIRTLNDFSTRAFEYSAYTDYFNE